MYENHDCLISTILCIEFPQGQSPGGGVLPYMGFVGMCLCEGYGFQAVEYINQSVWV